MVQVPLCSSSQVRFDGLTLKERQLIAMSNTELNLPEMQSFDLQYYYSRWIDESEVLDGRDDIFYSCQ